MPSDHTSIYQLAKPGDTGASIQILEMLRTHGAKLNECMNCGTPMDCARRDGHEHVVRWLEEHGA